MEGACFSAAWFKGIGAIIGWVMSYRARGLDIRSSRPASVFIIVMDTTVTAFASASKVLAVSIIMLDSSIRTMMTGEDFVSAGVVMGGASSFFV